jgi:hypothetical protein
MLVAKFLQDAFTRKIGIVLTGLGKFDDALDGKRVERRRNTP